MSNRLSIFHELNIDTIDIVFGILTLIKAICILVYIHVISTYDMHILHVGSS